MLILSFPVRSLTGLLLLVVILELLKGLGLLFFLLMPLIKEIFKVLTRSNENGIRKNDEGGSVSEEQMATLISLTKDNSINGIGLITDLGANQHMTDKFLVKVTDVTHLKINISHPNGTEAFITKIGNIPLTQYLTLYDVLVVHEYCVSLMVVHKFNRDSKLIVAFDEINCYVSNKDLRAGRILGTGIQISGLRYFNVNQGIEPKSSNLSNVCFVSKQTWHYRLGHPADQV
ncbi:hypothetical protein Tco_1471674 [Tanacetum coccineum]